MSRSTSSFAGLLKYLNRENTPNRFSWNMYADKDNDKELAKEFVQNSKYIRNSRGKIYLYHEIISLQDTNIDRQKSNEILYDLADHYISARASNHLVFGMIHNDKQNPHLHLVISSNRVLGEKRVRLSKAEFSKIQSKVESYKNEKYEELNKTNRYQSSKDKQKLTRKEQEIKHKRKANTEKEIIKQKLQDIFLKATNSKFLENSLKSCDYEIYQRGTTSGLSFNGKKYRLKTLGLDSEYKNTLSKINNTEKRQEKRNEFKQSR